MISFKKAKLDPTSQFRHPDEVLNCFYLSKTQKIKVLLSWEYDARELEVADEENMFGNDNDKLRDVLLALLKLNIECDSNHAPPTKHGGE